MPVIFIISNVVMCPMLFNLENGDYKLIMNDDTPDYEMEMSCDEGYEMTGGTKITCKNGLWNQTPSLTKCYSTYVIIDVAMAMYICMQTHSDRV